MSAVKERGRSRAHDGDEHTSIHEEVVIGFGAEIIAADHMEAGTLAAGAAAEAADRNRVVLKVRDRETAPARASVFAFN